ncbi:hypothetical protein K1719_039756 [Acacia pycnantha]|nr:hypothetical protein K1719_039756 [Acacia pycnantha]
MSINAGKLVCVTGAFGYVASWLVKLLLDSGYTVKAAVRDPNDTKNEGQLLNLDGAKERLHLIKANLQDEGSFDPVVEGCEGVFHSASPFYHNGKDAQAGLPDPTVKGTLNVLKSCAKCSSVKRVVLTSSMGAVAFNEKPRTPEVVVDESWLSDADFCRASQLWYEVSTTLREEAAWKYAKENNIDMVTINPGLVIGPLSNLAINTSIVRILKIINGAQTFPNLSFGWINVKDVAYAHIQAFEVHSANGRHCLVERVAHYSEVVKILRELYPQLSLPQKCEDDKPFVPTYQVSKEKARTLGIDEFIPLEVSLKETVESLKEKQLFKF